LPISFEEKWYENGYFFICDEQLKCISGEGAGSLIEYCPRKTGSICPFHGQVVEDAVFPSGTARDANSLILTTIESVLTNPSSIESSSNPVKAKCDRVRADVWDLHEKRGSNAYPTCLNSDGTHLVQCGDDPIDCYQMAFNVSSINITSLRCPLEKGAQGLQFILSQLQKGLRGIKEEHKYIVKSCGEDSFPGGFSLFFCNGELRSCTRLDRDGYSGNYCVVNPLRCLSGTTYQ
jgi:hypothetical protein